MHERVERVEPDNIILRIFLIFVFSMIFNVFHTCGGQNNLLEIGLGQRTNKS